MSTFNTALLRPDLASLVYHPVKPLDQVAKEVGLPLEQLVKLDANENLHGPPPAVVQAQLLGEHRIYPDPGQAVLRAAIGKTHGVSAERVVCGSGSDDILDILVRCVETQAIVQASPTFGMYSFLGAIERKTVATVPRLMPSFDVDVPATVAAIEESGAKLAFFPNPNNPTGTQLSSEDIVALCATDCIIVCDEAYAEFAESSGMELLDRFPNLVVMRTFSKWAGMAGLRVGYAIVGKRAEPLAAMMMGIKQPYNVNVAAEAAALAALELRQEILDGSVEMLKQQRARMLEELPGVPFLRPRPSQANFVLNKVVGRSAVGLAAALRAKGVLIRFFGSQGGDLHKYIRISAGRPSDIDRLMEVLREFPTNPDFPSLPGLPLPKAEVLIWDMDGVLADVSCSYRTCIVETAKHFGVAVGGEQISAAKDAGGANNDWELTHRLVLAGLEKAAPKPSYDEIRGFFRGLYSGKDGVEGLWRTEALLPPKESLEALAEGWSMAVVTGRPRDEAERFLEFYGIAGLFKTMVCMGEAAAKPSPEPVLLALKRLGEETAVALMFGDTPDDQAAAVAAGVTAIGVLAPGDVGRDGAAEALTGAGAAIVLHPLTGGAALKGLIA